VNKIGVRKFSNAYKDEYWNNFAKCFPRTEPQNKALSTIPEDVLSSLIGLIGEEQIERWVNSEIEDLDNIKPIDLIESEEGLKALKMFILSMPS